MNKHPYLQQMFLSLSLSLSLSRVWFVIPIIHLAAWYYPVDMYAMFKAYVLRKNLSNLSLKKQIGIFLTKKWSLVAHHVALFGIGYPLIAVSVRVCVCVFC